MRLLDRLERRFRHLAIPNLTVGIIVGQAFLYILALTKINPGLVENATLFPSLVLQGQVWRLFSFLFVPPNIGPLFAFFYFYLLYMMGTALEVQWGAFRYNMFLLIGALATIGAGFVANLFVPGMPVGNGYLYGTIFLAFAVLNPDFELLIMFILPVKIKWLALLAWLGYFYAFLFVSGWMGKMLIAASLLNFFCFFGGAIYRRLRSGQRKVVEQTRQAKQKRTPRHVCLTCGVTNLSDPKMRFRYCSMCEGQCGYCTEHINDHDHVIEGVTQNQR